MFFSLSTLDQCYSFGTEYSCHRIPIAQKTEFLLGLSIVATLYSGSFLSLADTKFLLWLNLSVLFFWDWILWVFGNNETSNMVSLLTLAIISFPFVVWLQICIYSNSSTNAHTLALVPCAVQNNYFKTSDHELYSYLLAFHKCAAVCCKH